MVGKKPSALRSNTIRDKNFIKGIMKKKNMNERDATSYFNDEYKNNSRGLQSKIKTEIISFIKGDGKTGTPEKTLIAGIMKKNKVKEFKYPKPRPMSSKQIKQSRNLKEVIKTRRTKTYSRIEKAMKKYPNASKFELQHGVNSVESEKYRERRGLPKKYELELSE